MPIMGGIDATATLRKLGIKTPIVALTANAMKDDRDRCKEAGVDDYLSKPIDLERFDGVLASYLEKQDIAIPEQAPTKGSAAMSSIQKAFEDDPEFLDIFRAFLDRLPGFMEQLKTAQAQGDLDALKHLAHNLKGTGGGFGFKELADVANKIQNDIINHQLDDLPQLTHQLHELCDQAVKSAA